AAEAFVESQLTKEERKRFVMDITSDDWGVRLVVPSAAMFAAGSDKFRPDAVAFANKLGQLIEASKRKVVIEGYVSKDETGPFKSTWEFSSARALNLLRYLQAHEHLVPERLA